MTTLEVKQQAVLKRIEWVVEDLFTHPITHLCPVCAGTQPDHSPECELASCLAAFHDCLADFYAHT
jgi:hypothetical protein